MSRIKKVEISDIIEEEEEDDDDDLRELLKKYIRRSQDLEEKESRVFKQIELMHSAVSSLQAYNDSRSSKSESARLNLQEIEEETKRIKEETKRIQKEVRQKIEENKKLQEEVDKKKRGGGTGPVFEMVTDSFLKKMDEDAKLKRLEREEIETRAIKASAPPPEREEDINLQFFNEKLNKLKEMEAKLKKESNQDSEVARLRKKKLQEKIEMLEWESEVDKQLIQSLKKKYKK